MSDQGAEYSAFIAAELGREFDRREKLGAQASAVLTTSTAVVSLVAGIVVFVLPDKFQFQAGFARDWLLAALAGFLGAGVCGIVAGFNFKYQVADAPTLNSMTSAHWTDSEVSARNIAAKLNVLTLQSLRVGNNHKATWLVGSFVMQLLATGSLGFAISRVV